MSSRSTPTLTDESIAIAQAMTRKADAAEPRAVRARFDPKSNRLLLDLRNGVTVAVPRTLLQGLADADPALVSQVEVTPSGQALHWEGLDTDFSVPALLLGIFGTRSWMAQLGREGGRVSSAAKAAAAKRNGLKGGRPRKTSNKR
ncbi:DUF2442 domain-containing protein [bacterium]|nr:MAG: DUF2442 domain-containing protein [bacterium]